jgi:hypothetical protein
MAQPWMFMMMMMMTIVYSLLDISFIVVEVTQKIILYDMME